MTDPGALLIPALAVVFLASILSGMTGFGFGLIAVPLLTIILPPQIVVPLARLHSLWSSGMVVLEGRRWLNLRSMWVIMAASLLTLPLGAYLLVVWDIHTLKVFIGSVTALSALAMLSGVRIGLRRGAAAETSVGLVSGLLGGSAGMAGPPVVIYFAGQTIEKHSFRVNLAALFMAQILASIVPYAVGKLLTPTVLLYTVLLLPAVIIGAPLGIKLSHRFGEETFRRLTLIAVLVTGLLGVASGLRLI